MDKENGDEKGYCCLYASARDFAKFSQLIMNNGSWNGEQLISKEYLKNAIFPAKEITEKSEKRISVTGGIGGTHPKMVNTYIMEEVY